MRAGFEYYRAIPQDAMQNQNYSKTNLTMPVLTLQGGYIPVFGGNTTMSSIEYGMKQLAQNVTSITVPNSGHWIAEEQPVFLANLLNTFFSGNATKTSN
jgi:pimeloyl-ACP methyl ester carboxylesterase